MLVGPFIPSNIYPLLDGVDVDVVDAVGDREALAHRRVRPVLHAVRVGVPRDRRPARGRVGRWPGDRGRGADGQGERYGHRGSKQRDQRQSGWPDSKYPILPLPSWSDNRNTAIKTPVS